MGYSTSWILRLSNPVIDGPAESIAAEVEKQS
jgi:hypothetical protein